MLKLLVTARDQVQQASVLTEDMWKELEQKLKSAKRTDIIIQKVGGGILVLFLPNLVSLIVEPLKEGPGLVMGDKALAAASKLAN